jgi:hypothetical protein
MIILKGLKLVKAMKKVYLADNNFHDSEEMLVQIEDTFKSNPELKRYDFKYNVFRDEGVEKMTEILDEAKHVYDVEISERIGKETLKNFQDKLKENKPGKKKKKKKKKA